MAKLPAQILPLGAAALFMGVLAGIVAGAFYLQGRPVASVVSIVIPAMMLIGLGVAAFRFRRR